MQTLDILWVILCGFMVLEMQAGFLCLEAGTTRAKNAANVALKNLADISIVCLAFWAVGYGLMFGPTAGGLIGTGGFLFGSGAESLAGESGAGSAAGQQPSAAPDFAFFFFQMAFASTAATILSGAVAERARFSGYLAIGLLVAALVYPVAGHWAWGGAATPGQEGWLQAMGFLDFAGSTVVHSVGGWAALAYAVALGPRL